MRPLPTLDPLAPSQSVYGPADSLDALLGGDLSNFDALQSLLDSTTTSTVSNAQQIQSDMDAIGAIFDDLDATFGQINASMNTLDYTQEIQATFAIDSAFASGLNSWTPDLAGGIAAFAALIEKAITDFILPLIEQVIALVEKIAADLLTLLLDAISEMFLNSSSWIPTG